MRLKDGWMGSGNAGEKVGNLVATSNVVESHWVFRPTGRARSSYGRIRGVEVDLTLGWRIGCSRGQDKCFPLHCCILIEKLNNSKKGRNSQLPSLSTILYCSV